MENNNWEPRIGQKVKALRSGTNSLGQPFTKDRTYEVESVKRCPSCGHYNVSLVEIQPLIPGFGICDCVDCPFVFSDDKCFISSTWLAPIPPAYENISQELAEKAMEVKPEVDVPVKREVVNN